MPNPSLHEPLPPALDVVPVRRMTEEEFVAWCDEDLRAEWVDGEVIMMSPGNMEHVALVGWLFGLLQIFTQQRELGVVLSEAQVRLGPGRSRRVPDMIYVAQAHVVRLGSTCLEGPPDLAIEIVSPDSVARDWREKYLEYEAAGVPEYWVIDPASQRMEAYALGAAEPQGAAGAAYHRLEEKDGLIVSAVLPGLKLRTAWLWAPTRPKILEALHLLGVLG